MGTEHDALFAEMLPLFERTFRQLGPELGKQRANFSRLLADIAMHSAGNPWHQGWLKLYMQQADTEDRDGWAQRVARNLRELPPEAGTRLWHEWLAKYWDERLTGVPSPIDPREGGAMVDWVLGLSGVMAEVVARVERTPVALGNHPDVFYELQQGSFAKRFPAETARLLRYLLLSSPQVRWECQTLDKLVRTLIAVRAEVGILREVCEQMARIQCPSAQELADLLDS